MRVRATKCYLVQIIDDAGNELTSEYVFNDRKGAEEAGANMLQELTALHKDIKEPIPYDDIEAIKKIKIL